MACEITDEALDALLSELSLADAPMPPTMAAAAPPVAPQVLISAPAPKAPGPLPTFTDLGDPVELVPPADLEPSEYQLVTEGLPAHVRGVIYIMRCTHPEAEGKFYVGQTRTHVMNHGKYRPFGVISRFKHHLSESRSKGKRFQCLKLNNAIRKYGEGYFTVATIGYCDPRLCDYFEKQMIRKYDAVAKGYNLTDGGSGGPCTMASRIATSSTNKEKWMKERLDKFKGMTIEYAKVARLTGTGVRIDFKVRGKASTIRTSFFGQHCTFEESSVRAMQFLRELHAEGPFEVIVMQSMPPDSFPWPPEESTNDEFDETDDE